MRSWGGNVSSYQWKQLESVENLLKPFAQYTTLTSGEDNTTISLVIPILLELQMHLDDEVSRVKCHTVSYNTIDTHVNTIVIIA